MVMYLPVGNIPIVNSFVQDLSTLLYTTETGRLRIQRQAWRLSSVANIYDFGHVALFFRRKRQMHAVTFLCII